MKVYAQDRKNNSYDNKRSKEHAKIPCFSKQDNQYCLTKLMEFEIYISHTTHHDPKQLTCSERESRKYFIDNCNLKWLH